MGFLKKLFGLGGSKQEGAVSLIEEALENMSTKSGLDFDFDVYEEEENIKVELSGGDVELFKAKEGQLLDAVQFFVKRMVQHQDKESRVNIIFDCDGFRESADAALVELADKLKGIVLEKNKPVYFRALPPRDRRVVHQHMAKDKRVVSKSIGDGLYKKIIVFPAGMKAPRRGNNNNKHATS